MARKPRIEFDGAFYHVIVRGNQRQRTFHDDRDREVYLQRIEHYRQRYRFNIYGYVLMPNHVHFLLETKSVGLSKIMQGIQGSYTQSYNRRHHKVGHLFQGRYRAILCDREPYLLELVRYIHLNPARVKVPEDPWRFRWSSYGAYLGKPSPVKVDCEGVMSQFSSNPRAARRLYQRFMEEGLEQGHDEKYYETIDQRLLGDESFVSSVAERTEAKEIEFPEKKIGFTRLLRAVCAAHGVDAEVIVQVGRQRRWVGVRAQLVYLARRWCGLTTKELGLRLNRDASMISRLNAWYETHRDERAERGVLGHLAQ